MRNKGRPECDGLNIKGPKRKGHLSFRSSEPSRATLLKNEGKHRDLRKPKKEGTAFQATLQQLLQAEQLTPMTRNACKETDITLYIQRNKYVESIKCSFRRHKIEKRKRKSWSEFQSLQHLTACSAAREADSRVTCKSSGLAQAPQYGPVSRQQGRNKCRRLNCCTLTLLTGRMGGVWLDWSQISMLQRSCSWSEIDLIN